MSRSRPSSEVAPALTAATSGRAGEGARHLAGGGLVGDHLRDRRLPRGELRVDQVLAHLRVRARLEALAEVEDPAVLEVAQRAHREHDHADEQDRQRSLVHEMPDSPPSGRAPLLACERGDRRPERAPAENREHGRQQGQSGEQHDRDSEREHGAHRLGRLEIGQREDKHRREDGAPGREDRRPGALGRMRHRQVLVLSPAQLLPESRDDQQAVVGAGPEHQDDQDPGASGRSPRSPPT